MTPNLILSKDQCLQSEAEKTKMETQPYAQALGSLRYAADCMCPNVAYATGKLAHYISNPGPIHWTTLKHVYQYLKQTSNYILMLGGAHNWWLFGYSDADGMSMEG